MCAKGERLVGGRRNEEIFFFPCFSHPSIHRDVLVAPAVPLEQPRVWGVSRDGVSRVIAGEDLCLLQRGGVGVGDRSHRGQSPTPALTLHPLLALLPQPG